MDSSALAEAACGSGAAALGVGALGGGTDGPGLLEAAEAGAGESCEDPSLSMVQRAASWRRAPTSGPGAPASSPGPAGHAAPAAPSLAGAAPAAEAPQMAAAPAAAGGWSALVPLEMQAQIDAMRRLGRFPPRGPELGGASGAWLFTERAEASLLQGGALRHPGAYSRGPHLVVFCWAAGFTLFLIRLFVGLADCKPFGQGPAARTAGPGAPRSEDVGRGALLEGKAPPPAPRTSWEREAWDGSPLSWLTASWGSRWVAAAEGALAAAALAPETMDHEKLGPEAHPDDAPQACHARFERLWRAELQRGGGPAPAGPAGGPRAAPAGRALRRALLRFVGWQKIAGISVAVSALSALRFVVVVLAVEVCLQLLERVAAAAEQSPHAQPDNLVPCLMAICLFSVAPVAAALLQCLAWLLEARVDMRVEAALTLAVHQKAQRLPSTSPPGAAARGGEPAPDGCGADLRAVHLLPVDVKVNLRGWCSSLCTLCLTVPLVATLAYMLWREVGASVLIGALGATPVLALAAVLLWRLPRAARAVQAQADLRMSLLKEVLGAPRTPGASRPPEAGLVAARAQELARLTALLVMAGCLGAVVFALPRLIVCCTLSVHAQLAGDVSARTIFVCMQVVANLKHLVDSSATRARRLPALLVSLRRIEVFLLAPEALPQRLLQDGPAPQGGQPSAAVRLRGSFSRCPDQPAALHRLELDVERGARVAVVGDAGSGKTSLLLAMLGELHPAPGAEATLACGRAAHCAAPPWLLRGSLQDNVLCGAPLEEGRYHAALAAAGLTPGSEGAAPAYGARVSIARAVYSRAGVVLVDDGLLGAAGAAAGRRAWERLLADPLMRGRACVAVVPADDQLAAAFEEVLVLSHGRVVAHGTPNAVVPSQEFRRLPRPPGPLGNGPAAGLAPGALAAVPGGPERADWQTWRFFLRSGQRGHLAAALALQALARAFSALGDVQLANWASSRAVPRGSHADSAHVLGYGLWLLGATLCFLGSCVFLARFSSTVAGGVFREVVRGLSRAPAGPCAGARASQAAAGLSSDLAQLDRELVVKLHTVFWYVFVCVTALAYVHFSMPWRFTVIALPCYAVLARMGVLYYKTSARLLHLERRLASALLAGAAEAEAAAVSARSLGAAALLDADFAARAAEQLKAQFLARTVMGCWLHVRVVAVLALLMTVVALDALLSPGQLGVGVFALSAVQLDCVMRSLPLMLQSLSELQFDFVCLRRLQGVALARAADGAARPAAA